MNLVCAGGAYSATYGAAIGVGAVVLGIAVNAAVDNSGGETQSIIDAIHRSINNERQKCRDQVSKVKQEWQAKFEAVIRDAEARKDLTVVSTFWATVRTALPVVQGSAPKPPSTNTMYKNMLMSYAQAQGWSSLIKGSDYHEQQFGTYYYISTSANPFQTADWLGWVDVSDLVDELNRLRGLPQ